MAEPVRHRPVEVRVAVARDAATLAGFNQAMAQETEARRLEVKHVPRGLRRYVSRAQASASGGYDEVDTPGVAPLGQLGGYRRPFVRNHIAGHFAERTIRHDAAYGVSADVLRTLSFGARIADGEDGEIEYGLTPIFGFV